MPKTRLAWVLLSVILLLIGGTVYGASSIIKELSTTGGQGIPGMMGIGIVPGSDIILGSWAQSERAAMITSFDASALKGAAFYLVMSSPNNLVFGYNNHEWMGRVPLSAQYVVDGVIKEARAPSSKFLDSGIEFRWGASVDDDNYLDPVPADVKQLTFVIPQIGPEWEGPWGFKIQLN